ncbi:MAG: hypothetical protein ABIA12_02325 [Candidatus Aenigmatarchaeota archaeon]
MVFEKPEEANAILSEIVKRINEDRRRMRLLEQSLERLENSLSALEGSALSQMSDFKLMLERIVSKIEAASARLNAIEGNVSKLGRGVDKAATKLELRQMESFIDLVNPVTSKFVTRDELDRAMEERVRKRA